MRLTENFYMAEFIRSSMAVRLGIENRIEKHQYQDVHRNIEILALRLQQVRDIIGEPIVITSGFRSPEVNKAVGGAERSDHLVGRAADITTADGDIRPLLDAIRVVRDRHGLNVFDQVIVYPNTFIHVSTRGMATNRGEMLTFDRENGHLEELS